ncbi:DUF4381 domain-containing protein [Vibrio atypicus]|uniref:DUF4381 domain-containing protein n=1 Tax=Vibrio atypicus TaxID=558271 RepID=UPI003735A4D8
MSTETQTSPLALQPIHQPDVPAWLPLAWGWWTLLAASLLLIMTLLLITRWNKKRLAPKKTALRLLATGNKPAEAIELVRQAALCYYPREEIAQLTGQQWYQFLDSQMKAPLFAPNQESWQQVLYSKQSVTNSDELIQNCRTWVEQALPPKRRRA